MRASHVIIPCLLILLWYSGTFGGSNDNALRDAAPHPQIIKIPALGLGTWKAKEGEAGRAVKHALTNGYTHIDLSPRYRNEKEIGEIAFSTLNRNTRHKLFLASKLWNTDHNPSRVRPALLKTLSDLHLTYLDLWYMHWPISLVPGHDTPGNIVHDETTTITSTWKAMESLYNEGLVRSLGVSNFNVEQLEALLETAVVKPVANQVELHPYLPQGRLAAVCKKHGIALVAYCPIGSPGNAALNKQSITPLIKHPDIVQISKDTGLTPAQVLLRWGVQKGVHVIPKSVTPSRIEENLASLAVTNLSVAQIRAVDNIRTTPPTRYCMASHYMKEGVTPLEFWGDDGGDMLP